MFTKTEKEQQDTKLNDSISKYLWNPLNDEEPQQS